MRDDFPAIAFGMVMGFMISTIIFIGTTRAYPVPVPQPQTQTLTVKHVYPEGKK